MHVSVTERTVVSEAMNVFDRRVLRMRRDRAAPTLAGCDFLLQAVGERLVDRLGDIRRRFRIVLDLGCRRGNLGRLLARRDDISVLVHCDLATAMARAAGAPAVVADEEYLPFRAGTFDLVLSLLNLHWVNDLPGALAQVRMALKPDGLFLAAMLGGGTLKELRQAWMEAEAEIEGGVSPRVSPFADIRDAGALLQRAGFALPVVDAETLVVRYADPMGLSTDLRAMGETNVVLHRRKTMTRRSTAAAAAARYASAFTGEDGRVTATFQILYLTAWAPDASQPQPARRGSGVIPLSVALGETPR